MTPTDSPPPNYENQSQRTPPLSANSAMSIGLAVTVVLAALWVRNGQTSNENLLKEGLAKNEIVALNMSNDIANLRRDLTSRNQDMLSMNAFIRWTNSLQRENNAAGNKLIVPEPR